MLKFDQNHDKLDRIIQKRAGKSFKNIFILGMLISSIVTFTGCDASYKCEIEGNHVHKYISSDGFILNLPYCSRYEKIIFKNYSDDEADWVYFEKTQDYTYVTEDEYDLYRFLYQNSLIRIDENQEALEQYISSLDVKPFLQYEYSYVQPLPGPKGVCGAVSCTDWTSNPNHENLTGDQRLCYPVYYGYNISKNENGKYELVKSRPYESYEELVKGGYQYISLHVEDAIHFSLDYEVSPEDAYKSGFVK